MSAATASSTDSVTVHVRLLDEGVDVWRPVQAKAVSQSIYRLAETPVPPDEVWAFQPGDIVVAEPHGATRPAMLVAVARASDFDERRRLAG